MVLTSRAPSKLLWAAEDPRAAWMVATWWRHRATMAAVPRGDGRAVMLLPGLFNGDRSNIVLRRYLTRLGYRAQGWGLGRNLGVRTVGTDADRLIARVAVLAAEAGPVTLIGVSLGGIMARLVAHRRPDLVRAVITVASPYAGSGTGDQCLAAVRMDHGRAAGRPRRHRAQYGDRATAPGPRDRDLEPQRWAGRGRDLPRRRGPIGRGAQRPSGRAVEARGAGRGRSSAERRRWITR
ncbi:MAG TPA: alpha/beta fold hydrolase [Sphingomonas sp.]